MSLLKTHPQRSAHAELQENRLREQLGDVVILKHRRHGISTRCASPSYGYTP
ncbi:MAG TPA: hypothetical protein VHN18_02955 [Micromonosporaceae bacterium]|nr:hypothetical protein [Micromonosporaceae bacterium]